MEIESYDFGRIVIAGRTYTSDLILLPDRVLPNWWRREGHELHPDDLKEVLEAHPQVLVVGTGYVGRMRILPQSEALLSVQGIRLIAQDTRAACRTYNELHRAGGQVAAALHLTC
ncbi:MAG: Mth938-like domain-containing protein [Chloroflexia bacterium]